MLFYISIQQDIIHYTSIIHKECNAIEFSFEKAE